MNTFAKRTDVQLGEIVQRIGIEQDIKQQRQGVFDALAKLGTLSIEDHLTISKSLCRNNADLDLFFSISDENRAVMVKMMLEGVGRRVGH